MADTQLGRPTRGGALAVGAESMPTNGYRFQRARALAKGRLLPAVFRAGQRLGVDVLPRHFYSEIPDMRRLRENPSWRRPLPFDAVRGADLGEQLQWLQACVCEEVRALDKRRDLYGEACNAAGFRGFGPIEAVLLFAFVHHHRPSTVVQVGAGTSTSVVLQAAAEADYQPRIVCVDPFPTAYLRQLASEGRIEIVELGAQEPVALRAIEALQAGDLFFVDSSHTLGPAGEVTRLVAEWLPSLPQGAHAHFHDIYFPYDYSPSVLTDALFFWHETALLHSFLQCNDRFRLTMSMSMLHHAQPAALGEAFSRYRPAQLDDNVARLPGHYPSSAYLLRDR